MSNVSEITQQLMDLIQPNSDLRDVWMQGEISNVNLTRNGNTYFTLKDNIKKLNVSFSTIGHLSKKICLQSEAVCLSTDRFMSIKPKANIDLWSKK